MFQFKQFAVDQTNCAMKINTDGVLLGALAEADKPGQILDIGTGTGVIALMLAQRFSEALIDAVEIDSEAAATAGRNFTASPFSQRLRCYLAGFSEFFTLHPGKQFDLIVSNPPFHLNSLKSPGEARSVARHTDGQFFDELLKASSQHLSSDGTLWLILPVETSLLVQQIAAGCNLHLVRQIAVKSYSDSKPHRYIIVLSNQKTDKRAEDFTIYQSPKVYTEQYQATLHDFFTIF